MDSFRLHCNYEHMDFSMHILYTYSDEIVYKQFYDQLK